MKVSVALATYNGERYIESLLESILDQTRKVDEVVIHDDGSHDRTAELIASFISEHGLEKSWSFAVNPSNLGFAENFRKTIDECTGDLIFFCDQDDIWVGDRVAVMTEEMERNRKISLLCSRYQWFTDEPVATLRQTPDCAKLIRFSRKTKYLGAPGCVMAVRKDFLDTVKDQWIEGWAHDEAMWNLALISDGLYGMKYISLMRREHKDRTSGKIGHGKEKRIEYLTMLSESSRKMHEFCLAVDKKRAAKKYQRYEKVAQLRQRLVAERKLSTAFALLPYLRYYHKKRSYLVEVRMAMRKM